MSSTSRASNPQYHVDSLREYVLAPLSTAASHIEREQAELAVERDAFREFRERVTEIEPTPAASTPRRLAADRNGGGHSNSLDRVRSAYRETVMDVPHYEDVYEESFEAHVAAEFGSELAHQLCEESAASFTLPLRERLRVAAQRAIEERRALLDRLDDEGDSVAAARSDLAVVLQPLSSTVIPEWHRETFARRLDAIAERRQETLHDRGDLPDGSDYSLSTYLYRDDPWSHPVLTAVARVRETVTFEEGVDGRSSGRVHEST